MIEYHNPVLLKECIEGLNIKPNGIYVDVTFGSGGHSKEILKKLTTGKLFAFDQDEDSTQNKIIDERFIFIRQNFKYLKNFLKMNNVTQVDGLLADLGVSSHQFDQPERGFSTRFDSKLDMRMDKNSIQTAAEILNTYTEEDLKRIFKEYGEINNAGKIAYVIVNYRKEKKIETISQLKDLLSKYAKPGKENQYFAQVFQALRIEVNKELDVLKDLLTQSLEVLKNEGRLVVISYHSLEDRLVKNFMRSGKFEGEVDKDFFGKQLRPLEPVTRKAIIPSQEECSQNSRARSAKLRIAEKL
jgi:16S rRNA (cytosine1402-N4)-methyltransferase